MASFTASPPTSQATLPPTDDPTTTLTRLSLIESNASRDYGFRAANTIPAFLRRKNISCAPATVGLAKTRAEWDKHCGPISWTAYERMKPAFERVGAMMMMSEPFFAKLLFARAEVVESNSQSTKSRTPNRTCLDQRYVTPMREEWDEYSRIHQLLPSRLRLFMGRDDHPLNHPDWHGYTKCGWHESSQAQLSLHINSVYLKFFSDRDYEHWSEETKNNILFQLAITVGHELAHMMWLIRVSIAWRVLKEKYPNRDERPYFDKQQAEPLYDPTLPESELGNVWEHYMFGGVVRFANEDLFNLLGRGGDLIRVSGLEYAFSHDFNVKDGKVVPGEWYTLDSRIVKAFFDDKKFDAAFKRRLASNSQPQRLTVMSILDALALEPQLKIPSPRLQQSKEEQSTELKLAEGLSDASAEIMADLEGLEIT